ncbi:MAG: winged helix-turn-helix domain-containing protein [Chloroflexi bacterium]|nr:winged helix-turn-helix domain-containing protein [Chloroflexota bacterium]MCL5274300.1 winged helix-turn-helix domain-containing protein [Chloroflexota bacterium]
MIRKQEIQFLLDAVSAAECVSIMGLSNMGKSALARELCTPAVRQALLGERSDDWLFVYVDCNLMPERSEQALHEVILRATLETMRHSGAQDGVMARLDKLYEQVIQPPSPLRSPLAFNDAINFLCDESGRPLVLLFDEFDDPFGKLDGRTFLNLRAMKDHLASALTYVTVTEQPLADIRTDREATEFIELFTLRARWVGFLNEADARTVVRAFAADSHATWQPDEIDFVVAQAGGHPGLLQGVLATFMRVAAGAPDSARPVAFSVARQSFDNDAMIRHECQKLWTQLSDAEQAELMAYVNGERGSDAVLAQLQSKRLLASDDEEAAARPVAGELWTTFIRRHALARQGLERGVRVDVDSGEVYAGGRRLEQLTELEYKLVLLMYGRLNKIVDKYAIVTQVWGENYLDDVDDARIEKLVSRLRAKLEPDAVEPKYLLTVRGRGYKLVG